MNRRGICNGAAMRLSISAFALLAGLGAATAAEPSSSGTDPDAAGVPASEPGILPAPGPQPSAMDQTDSDAASNPPAAEAQEDVSPAQKLIDTLVMRDGVIALPGGQAKVNVAKDLAFLDEKDARTLIVDVYGNPPDVAEGVLGVLLPRALSPLAAESWFAILTYEEDGHVSDEDASSINYDDLLKEIQEATDEESKTREKAGYETIKLVGWAQSPSYDKAAHKLYWAKDVKFGKSDGDTLNYAIRALGRTGVLQVNVVADIKQLPEINAKIPELLNTISFNDGQRYADFNESTDAVAAYGLAGLIAGGVAAKAGLFKGLWVLLLASKKFLIAGAIAFGGAIWGGIRWLMGRKQA